MSNASGRLATIPSCLLIGVFAASCQQAGNSTPDAAAASGGRAGSSSAQTGGSSGTGGRDTALTGGARSTGGDGGSAGSGGAGGAASGGNGAGGPGGAGGAAPAGGAMGGASGGNVASGGARATGGTTGQGGASGAASDAGVAGQSGSGGGGGAARTGGTASAGGTTGQGGSGGGPSTPDAGAAGQGGGDAGTTTLAADSLAVRFANAVMARWPDPTQIYPKYGYEYNDGIVLRGIEQVYRHTSDAKYLTYIQKYIDAYVSASGVVNIPAEHSFDNIQPSILLPFLFQQTGTAKYKTAADNIRARYDTIPRNSEGGFWHKQANPNQMWLDTIYMSMPFLARYGAVINTCGTFCATTVVEQILLIAKHVRDANTGLLYHAWDASPTGKQAWADPITGRSPCVWSRALGWYAMSLVDTLGDLPANQTGRAEMLSILTSLAAGLKANQDAKTGLWFQVVDQGSKSDNWDESSGSGMFVYALKVAVNRGYIDSSYSAVADAGWKGLQTKVGSDSTGPTITGAVPGMGVQTSYAGYVGQSQATNTAHGLCGILLAAAEMEAR